MTTATRQHLSVVDGLAKFAKVTVGQPENQDGNQTLSTPEVVLNDYPVRVLGHEERALIEAAQRGMREAETELEWQTPRHVLLRIEGLEVDGIDAAAAYSAAREATMELIRR